MNIVKQFVESAKSTSDMQDRLTYIMNLTSLDRTEFYSADVGLPGGAMNSLRSCGVVSRVPGKEKDAFICIDSDEELYKRVPVNCWRLTVAPATLRLMLHEYCNEMIDLFSAVRMMAR